MKYAKPLNNFINFEMYFLLVRKEISFIFYTSKKNFEIIFTIK